MAYCSIAATTLNPSPSFLLLNKKSTPHFFNNFHSTLKLCTTIQISTRLNKSLISQNSVHQETQTEYETGQVEEEEYNSSSSSEEYEEKLAVNGQSPPPVLQRRRRYRKKVPGEDKGISEEMRFVAMRMRNSGKRKSKRDSEENEDELEVKEEEEVEEDNNGKTWQPSLEGFLKYMVDSELVFNTVERIVDESSDVSYVYFRKTGLERSKCFSRDLEWFKQQGNVIPEPSTPGVTYAQYLNELAEKNPPLFLCHFYNIYFSHIAGGQVIAKRVSENLLEGRDLEFYRWEGDAEDLLRGVRQNLNALGEHWSRDEKNKCLREATKTFRFLGQIVRLIIL